MNFEQSERYLYSLGNEVEAMKLGLENIRVLLVALGNPHEKYFKVQVAGTNGKGSVCAFLDSICRQAEIRVGLYTSPHLTSITERIRIDGIDINEDEFARLATLVRETAERLLAEEKLGYTPTYFEQVTAIGLLAFAEAKVELAILETGLGGRLDATTAANAEIAAITQIALDHQEYLGDTIEEIAAEKAAIIRSGSRVVIGEQCAEAEMILLARCDEVGVVPLTYCEVIDWATDTINRSPVVSFRTEHNLYGDLVLGLKGRHQVENGRVAVMLADILRYECGLALSDEHVEDGLENARHPGRLEYVGNRYLLDGAHNVAGAKAMAAFIDGFESRPITLIFGAMNDKDVAEMLAILLPVVDRLILTRPSNTRAYSAEELIEFLPEHLDETKIVCATSDVEEAVRQARQNTPPNSIIVVTGSLYLVGEVRKIAISL